MSWLGDLEIRLKVNSVAAAPEKIPDVPSDETEEEDENEEKKAEVEELLEIEENRKESCSKEQDG